jgi:hypothetical protein
LNHYEVNAVSEKKLEEQRKNLRLTRISIPRGKRLSRYFPSGKVKTSFPRGEEGTKGIARGNEKKFQLA